MYLIIDNYDSFTYNLYQYMTEIGIKDIKVARNNKITVDRIRYMHPEGIIISPGPGRPQDAGISVETVKHFAGKIPILGVCLGHQAIGYTFGARIIGAQKIVHGKIDRIYMDGKGLFRNIPSPAQFTRYHSLIVVRESLPECFEVTAVSSNGKIMGIRHKDFILEGIQFHPESIASEYGKRILENFIHYKKEPLNVPMVISKILEKIDLSKTEASYFMEELTEGHLTNAQIAAFLIAFNAKGVTAPEIAGLASVLNRNMNKITIAHPVLDTCGTGGDEKQTFNISSLAAIVASSCGVSVAKHGNRSVSSQSGSADFYEKLGIPINLEPEKSRILLKKTGFCFLFAPLYHESMKHAAQVRREIGIKTVMNILGPLINPAYSQYQLIGVFSEDLLDAVADAAILLGKKRVMVVHGLDGLDEISVTTPTQVVEIDENNNHHKYLLEPSDYGIPHFNLSELRGGNPEQNTVIAYKLLNGKGNNAVKEAVQLNAGAALYVAQHAPNIKEGYYMAKEAIESKRTLQKLEEIVKTGKMLKSSLNYSF